MSVWFEGENEINCDIQRIKDSFEDLGQHYRDVVALMPGLVLVELVEHGPDFVTIKTNEGMMRRTNIVKTLEPNRVTIEFDEEYEAGTKITATSHFLDEFTGREEGVLHRLVMSDVNADGVLGFFYRHFAKSNIGNALLGSYKTFFESH